MEEFTFVPLYAFQAVGGYRVLTTDMESGVEYRYYKNRRPREWTLGFRDIADNIKQIQDFFNRHKGAYASFLWLPPNETQYIKCRFKQEALEINWHGIRIGECQVVLREIL